MKILGFSALAKRASVITFLFLACVFQVGCASSTAYYVDPAGKGGKGNGTRTFTTVQAAMQAIPVGNEKQPTRLYIYPGTYNERVTVDKDFVQVAGLGSDPTKTIVVSNGTGTSTKTGSFNVVANHFTAKNLTFKNSVPNGPTGHPTIQALALAINGDENAFENCHIDSFQDTLYFIGGREYFKHCAITGITDFIYGNATAVLNECTIDCPPSAAGHITAANTQPTTPIGIVIMNSTLTGFGKNQTDMGRPWNFNTGSYASVIYLNDKMGPHIKETMWNPWVSRPPNDNPAGDTRFAVHGLTTLDGKPFDMSKAVNYSHVLSDTDAAQLTLPRIFGPASNWDFGHWGVGDSTIWGPVNKPGTSGVTRGITATAFQDWPLGGTWDAEAQLQKLPNRTAGK